MAQMLWRDGTVLSPSIEPGNFALPAAWLDHWKGYQIRRQVVRRECFHPQSEQTEEGHTKVGSAVRTIHRRSDGDDQSSMSTNDVHRFLHSTALGDDVFDDEQPLTRGYFETAAQDEFSFFLFHENEPAAELTRDLLAEHEAAHGRSDHGFHAEVTHFSGQRRAELLDQRHLLQGESTLEVLPAVQAAAQDEMAFEQGARIKEELQHFSLSHSKV